SVVAAAPGRQAAGRANGLASESCALAGLECACQPSRRRDTRMWSAYPNWLNPGDNAWQLTAATLVGLMSIPGLVVLYGGVMQKRWSVNSMMLAFVAFALVLVEWVLYGYKMGFGNPWHGRSHSGCFGNFVGQPGHVLDHKSLQGQGNIPLVGKTDFPQSSLVYFQFVFAGITPILMLGSVLGRVNFKAWIPFVVLWGSCV